MIEASMWLVELEFWDFSSFSQVEVVYTSPAATWEEMEMCILHNCVTVCSSALISMTCQKIHGNLQVQLNSSE